MGDTNYLASTVKILEEPTQILDNNKVVSTEFRAQLVQVRNSQIINLIFWGNLARDVASYYHVNDYILIEGYVSLQNKKNTKSIKQNLKTIQITVLKIYSI
jgi:hypothetical protein